MTSKTQLLYLKSLQDYSALIKKLKAKRLLLIVDEKVQSRSDVQKFTKSFEYSVPVKSGESLKSLKEYGRVLEILLPMTAGFSPQDLVVLAVGGGSVGDFAGFIASTLKRGIRLVHVPTTWLAAMDSAHGGKTALNVGEFKNQIGTFYPAETVLLIQPLLFGQPADNVNSGFGEAMKMAVLDGPALFGKMSRLKQWNEKVLWSLLPKLIAAKMKVVAKDPHEKKGLRHILNLGHTLGHAIELEHMLPHGMAVQVGLDFAVEWSAKRGLLNKKEHERIRTVLRLAPARPMPMLDASRLMLRLAQDKKSQGGDGVKFIFLKSVGKPVVQFVKFDEVVHAAKELGWAR